MIPIRCKAVSGVALTTVDGETKLLVMKRVKGGFWCHVAGTVEAGETGWQTIIREFGEETGIRSPSSTTASIWSSFTRRA